MYRINEYVNPLEHHSFSNTSLWHQKVLSLFIFVLSIGMIWKWIAILFSAQKENIDQGECSAIIFTY